MNILKQESIHVSLPEFMGLIVTFWDFEPFWWQTKVYSVPPINKGLPDNRKWFAGRCFLN